MKNTNYNGSRLLKIITNIFCVIIGLTFISSGFVKAVDPWGTAIKFDEYFTVYGLESLMPLSKILAVWLCGAELMMGCMILFKVRLRLISIFALLSMSGFTILTILSATILPVEDCGCFGDALILTPWQTVLKNVVLLPMVITIWWRYRPDRIFAFNIRECILATVFCICAMGFSAYNFLYLPMIDFLPYKVGVNLMEEVLSSDEAAQEYSVVLIYRNIESGQIHEFSIDDTQWHNSDEWEWVDTRTDADKQPSIRASLRDFALFALGGEEATADILSTQGHLNMICITNFNRINSSCQGHLDNFVANAYAAGARTVVLTPQSLNSSHIEIGGFDLECFNIDGITLKTMLRAKRGAIELEDGVIVAKKSCMGL